MAEVLSAIDTGLGAELAQQAYEWKKDILTSFYYARAQAPVVPLGDGTWCPTVPAWTEGTGPRALYVDNETFYSHGTFTVADVLLGPMYLVFCEVLDYSGKDAEMLLDYHQELFYQDNAAFSQPYYSRHNWVQLKRGMVKPFLQTYYHTFSALSDHETYAFWEHLYHASPYKTHEQAWFLMQTRWMLWQEQEKSLHLLSAIPRKWLSDGQTISLDNVASYFGPLSLHVTSAINNGEIIAEIFCPSDYQPESVMIRLPHPEGLKAKTVIGGRYDPVRETITITPFNGRSRVVLKF